MKKLHMALGTLFYRASHTALHLIGSDNKASGSEMFYPYNYNGSQHPSKKIGFTLTAERDNLSTIFDLNKWNLRIKIQHYGVTYCKDNEPSSSFKNMHPLTLDCESDMTFETMSQILDMQFETPEKMIQALLESEKMPAITRHILSELKNAISTNQDVASSLPHDSSVSAISRSLRDRHF